MALSRKFGRNYFLRVQTKSGTFLEIEPPFTIEFDIIRNVMSSANVSSLRIYNLNAHNRSQIRKNINDYGDYRRVQLSAGYGKNLGLIFDGNITQAWSVREGVNFITQIESFDGGYAFANAISNVTFPAQTAQRTVIDSLVGDLSAYGVTPGAIGDFPQSLTRGNSYSGQTCSLLQELTGGRFFIDSAKAYALADNECVEAVIPVINAESGLLGTPVREQTIVNFEMLFEPNLFLGQKAALDSITTDDKNVNGIYKVVSLKHRGMISEAVCGDAITSVGLLQPLGSQGLISVPGVS